MRNCLHLDADAPVLPRARVARRTSPDAPLTQALAAMHNGIELLLVVENGQVQDVVPLADLVTYLIPDLRPA